MALGTETIRARLPGVEVMGDPGEPGAPQTFEGCVVFPGTSTERQGREATVTIAYTVLLDDPAANITAGLEVEWAKEPDVWYPVHGKPGRWYHLDGSPAGLEVQLLGGEG